MKVFKSAPNSLRMLLILMIAVVLLNISNFLFYFLVDVPFRPKYYFSEKGANDEINNLSPESGSQSEQLLWIHGLFSVTRNKSTPIIEKSYKKGYHLCDEIPEGLGPVVNDSSIMTLKALKNMFFEVYTGGLYVPECDALQSVAILVIFRNGLPGHGRESRVGAFLYYMHPFLMKQKIEYQIFVLEQTYEIYNAGALLNVGYHEVMKLRPEGWSCIIFHDIDLYPCDTRNLYRCSDNPKQMVSSCDSRFVESYLQGVVAVTPEQFESTGGFSMVAWGSTQPDYDDLYQKFMNAGFQIETGDEDISSYNSNLQQRNPIENDSEDNTSVVKYGPPLLKFSVEGIQRHRLFTSIHIFLEYPVPTNGSNHTDSLNNIKQ